MTCTYLSQLIVSLKTQAQQSFLHLQLTRQQLSLDQAGLLELDVASVNSSRDYFHIYVSLQVKPRYTEKNVNFEFISPSTTLCRNQEQK
jgi:hypothetical protein